MPTLELKPTHKVVTAYYDMPSRASVLAGHPPPPGWNLAWHHKHGWRQKNSGFPNKTALSQNVFRNTV
jgi:hypothetical protein